MFRKLIVPVLVLMSLPALAVQTSHWTHTNEADFKKGTMHNVVATNFGDVKLSRAVKTIMEEDARRFHTHPPLFKRVAIMKTLKLQPLLKLKAPATILFKDFEELSKMATIQLYGAVLGKALRAEHLIPTDVSGGKNKP